MVENSEQNRPRVQGSNRFLPINWFIAIYGCDSVGRGPLRRVSKEAGVVYGAAVGKKVQATRNSSCYC